MNGRVLLVDSDAVHRASARDALLAGGYDVIEFTDGARALAYLRKDVRALPSSHSNSKAITRREGQTTLRPAVLAVGDVDAIMIDWTLPGLSGGELLARLRGDGDERPVIVSSSTATAEDAATMLSLGADDVLVKPVHHRMLVARITAQLRRRRMPALSAGELLDGRYRLMQELGESRVGTVWRAKHSELDIDVDCAIVGSRGSEALRREAARTATVTVPGFLRVRDIARLDTSRHIAVCDALPTQTAKGRLERGIAPELAFHIVTSVLDVVIALHARGLAHRNLSANSVFVDDRDDVVVADGAALRLVSVSRRRVGMTAYLPPETTTAGRGKEADVYAVGRLACHLLTGTPETIPEHAVAPALTVALAPQPSDRCTAKALLRAVAIAGKSRRRGREKDAERRTARP